MIRLIPIKFKLLLILFFLSCSWASLHAEIQVLPQREYFATVHELIANAESSIDVEMFLVYSNNLQVKKLLDEIVEAKGRGVKVSILLEDKQEENKISLEYLKSKGVMAKFDEPEIKLHAKMILIDDKKLVIGSSNWTKAAYERNNESNVIVDIEEDKDRIQILRTDYVDALLEAIDSAEREIDIIIYSFQFQHGREGKNYDVMAALLRAYDRGVNIRIIFDSWKSDSKNEPAYQILKQTGAKVYYDLNTIATHNKLVIIDNKIVFLGSANWTVTGLTKNREASILIRDPLISRIYNAYVDELIASLPEKSEAEVPIPVSFLKKDGILWKLYRKKLGQCLKLYCWFMWEAFKKETFTLERNDKRWYEAIYGKPALPWITSKRVSIYKIVRRLEKEGAIKKTRNKVVLINLKNMGEDWGEKNCILVSPDFWNWGWTRKLSSSGLYFYLVNLFEFKRSSYKPVWINSQKNLSMEYEVSKNTIQEALKELMHYNIIEIRHDIPDPGQAFNKRRANRYFINPLWSEEGLELKWKRLTKRHGPDLFHKARDLAAEINEPYDPEIVADMIMFIRIYGEEAVTEAVDTATKLSFANGKWEMRYVIGILHHNHRPLNPDPTTAGE